MKIKLTLFIAIYLLITACGGGGGGSGGGSGGSVSGDRSGIRIIHGVIDAPPISITSSLQSTSVLRSAFFAEESPRVAVGTGEQILSIFKKGSPEATFSNVSLIGERGFKKSLVLAGELETLGLQAALVDDGDAAPGEAQAALRVIHAAVGANTVEVVVGDQASVSAAFGGASEYVTVGAGAVLVSVRRAADQKLIYQGTLNLQARAIYSLAVLGDLHYLVVGRLLAD